MSLRKGLDSLPHDRVTEASVKEILLVLVRHEGEWLAEERVIEISGVPVTPARPILSTLVAAGVLSIHGEPPRYRYAPDRFLSLEVDSFLRRAEVRTGKLQDNVARFRERYGAH